MKLIVIIASLVLSGCLPGKVSVNERSVDVSLIVDGQFEAYKNKDAFKKYLNDFIVPFQINDKDCMVTLFPSVNVMAGNDLILKQKIPQKQPKEYISMARKRLSLLKRMTGVVTITDLSKVVSSEFLKEDISSLWKGDGIHDTLSMDQLLKSIPNKTTDEAKKSREFVIVQNGEKSDFDFMVKEFGFIREDILKSDSIFHIVSRSQVLTEYQTSIKNHVCKNYKNPQNNLDVIVIDVTGFKNIQKTIKSNTALVKKSQKNKIQSSALSSKKPRSVINSQESVAIKKVKSITRSKPEKTIPIVPLVPVTPSTPVVVPVEVPASETPSTEKKSITSCEKLLNDLQISLKRQEWMGERKPWNIANQITMQSCSKNERHRYSELCPAVQAIEPRFSCPE